MEREEIDSKIIKKMVEYIRELPDGTQVTPEMILEKLYPGREDLIDKFRLNYGILEQLEKGAKSHKILLKSLVPENIVGILPLKWEYEVQKRKAAAVKKFDPDNKVEEKGNR